MKGIIITITALLLSAMSFGQSNDGLFHDDLLDHLSGTWKATATAHGFSSTGTFQAAWVLNHQHMNIKFRGDEVVPWIGVPMEFEYFIGYKHAEKKYIVHEMTVFGSDGFEGFCYAVRSGNELKLLQKESANSDTTIVQTITWMPASKSWHIKARLEVDGKSGEVFLDMNLTAIKP